MSDLNLNLFLEAGGGVACCASLMLPMSGQTTTMSGFDKVFNQMLETLISEARSGFEKGVFANVSMDQEALCLQAEI